MAVKKEKTESDQLANDMPAIPDDQTLPNLPVLPKEFVESTPCADDSDIQFKKPKLSALDELFGDIFVVKVEPAKSVNERVSLEVKTYETEAQLELRSCPLSWWNINSPKYPLLSDVAKYFLGIPATSVASERVFSTAGDIVCAQRATLDSNNVDMLIFLKKNIEQVDN